MKRRPITVLDEWLNEKDKKYKYAMVRELEMGEEFWCDVPWMLTADRKGRIYIDGYRQVPRVKGPGVLARRVEGGIQVSFIPDGSIKISSETPLDRTWIDRLLGLNVWKALPVVAVGPWLRDEEQS